MSEAKVIVVGNEKGGAGKSTLAIHIVAALLEAGRHVAVIDLDLRQKSVARFFANRRAWLAANNQTLPEPSVADLGDGAARAALDGLSPRFEPVTVNGRELVRLKVGAPADTAAEICRAAQISDPWCAAAGRA